MNLRIAHLRIGHMVGNPEVGNPEPYQSSGLPTSIITRFSPYLLDFLYECHFFRIPTCNKIPVVTSFTGTLRGGIFRTDTNPSQSVQAIPQQYKEDGFMIVC